jgi:heat shock transcription factor
MKEVAAADVIGSAESPNATATAMPGASGATSANMSALNHSQILDIHSVVQGIAAISAELTELKRSNEMLWQDALLAREKHQQQEDTINRIVKFLAGVFGNCAPPGAGGVGGDGHHGKDENPGTNVSVQRRSGSGGNGGMGVGPKRRVRLMIEDVRRQNKSVPAKQGMNVVEVTEESDDDATTNDATVNGIGGGAGREQSTSPVTLSDYPFPPSPFTGRSNNELNGNRNAQVG